MRMWLSEDSPPHDDPGSPPLEGGEALCEFMLDPYIHDLTVLRNLPTLLEENTAVCMKDVFPKIQAVLPLSQSELQLEASNSFLTILEKELVPTATFTQTFLQSILTSVDSTDPVVATAWLETLMEVIDLLPQDIIKKDILSLAVSKGQHSQHVSSRLASCKILGKICSKFEPYFIKKEILPIVQSLCQDVDYEVRGCIARQLDTVARGLGLEIAKNAILPWLVELSNDESSFVRLASIETVVNMLSLLDDEICVQTIIPLVKKFCETSLKMEDAALPIAAKQLGRLCYGLSVNLNREEKQWFLHYYRRLAKLGMPLDDHNKLSTSLKMPDIVPVIDGHDKYVECRQSCAYNFPAMVLFAEPQNFKIELFETFCDLVSDPHSKVRRTMACGFHEVAKLLGPNVSILQPQLVSLLQDDCIEVLEGLIPELPVTLEAMAREGSMKSDCKLQNANDITQALIACEQVISRTSNWRLHSNFLEKLSCLAKCLTSKDLYQTFVPLYFHKLYTARPIPCRIAAAHTLLTYLRHIPVLDHRREICTRLVEEFCNGRSCHSRMLFISVCSLVMELFSKAFFKVHFFKSLLQLADDPVANIRLRLCSMLPSLKMLIMLPADEILLQGLEACVRKLMASERDRDVSAALQNAILELDKIEVMDATNKQGGTPEDAADQAKEEEENFLLQMEAQLKINSQDNLDGPVGYKNTRIPSLGRRPYWHRLSQTSDTILMSNYSQKSGTGSRLDYSLGHSEIPSRSVVRQERSAIPLLKKSPLSGLCQKPSADSPMPSPETIRRAAPTTMNAVGNERQMTAQRLASSETSSESGRLSRYSAKSSHSEPGSPVIMRHRWPNRGSPPISRVSSPMDYHNPRSNSPSNRFSRAPHCQTTTVYTRSNHDDLDLDFCGELIISDSPQLSPEDEERLRNWTEDEGSEDYQMAEESQIPRCTTPPVFSMTDMEINLRDESFNKSRSKSPNLSSFQSSRIPRRAPTPMPDIRTNSDSPRPNRRSQSSIPQPSYYNHNTNTSGFDHCQANTASGNSYNNSSSRNNSRTRMNSRTNASTREAEVRERSSSPRGRQPTTQSSKGSALTRAKSTSQLSPGLNRKLSQLSVAKRSPTQSPMGRSPSAPGTPRCMSPVMSSNSNRLQSGSRCSSPTRSALHLHLNQGKYSRNSRFSSHPTSPISVSGDSDGQATPDSPCSYGSNDSSTSDYGGVAPSRIRRLSGGNAPSKIPSLITRKVSLNCNSSKTRWF